MTKDFFSQEYIKKIVKRNSVVYRCFTPDPAQALFFGNGPCGGTVHTPDDSLYLLLGRCDNWGGDNHHGSIAAVRIKANKGLFQKARSVRQVSDMYEANITISIDAGKGKVKTVITALRGTNLIVIDIADTRKVRTPFSVSLENWHEGDCYVHGTDFLGTVHVNMESVFDHYNRRVGLSSEETADTPDPLRGRAWGAFVKSAGESKVAGTNLVLPSGSAHRLLIALPGIPPAEGADQKENIKKAGEALIHVPRGELKEMFNGHSAFWRSFWTKSFINLESNTGDAEYEERLWYVTLYSIICASGGGLPPRFNGAHFLYDKDARSWDYEYVFQNMREVYWPLFAAGHYEYITEYFDLYFSTVDFVRKQTMRLFGLKGLIFRECFTLWGACLSTNVLEDKNNRGNVHVGNYFSGSLEFCLLMEWYVNIAGNEDFLKEKLYPVLREVLQAYFQYAKKGDDGLYHLEPVNATETWSSVRDSMTDLCGLRHFLPRAILWGKKFNDTSENIALFEDFYAHLPELPVGRWTITREFWKDIHAREYLEKAVLDPAGVFLPAGGTSKRTERTNMENAELYAIFPWGFVGKDSPEEEVRRAENTWNHRTWKYINNGWAQDVPQLARMGWAEKAKAASLEHAAYCQRFPNGTFGNVAKCHFHGLLTDTLYLDTSGVHAAGINEMLLQSYDGIIRLAPALSDEWSGSFRLHAFGGFIIEAVFAHGLPVSARIHASRTGQLKLKNHRNETMLTVAGKKKTGTASLGVFEKNMQAGDVVNVRWQGVAAGNTGNSVTRPEVVYPGYKNHPPRVATRTGHWHDESINHGQAGLTEDGLFPATRK